jgi:ParB family chromosome partitioning protein
MSGATRKRGLGSGLDALIAADPPAGGVREVPVDKIRENPHQPRVIFDQSALVDLAASIREHGIIQPLIVSQRGDGGYELIAGERRWRAAQIAGLERVPVVVRETTPQQLLELALIENVQRADLNALEEAQAFQALKDEFGLSDDQIARRLGINSRVTVTNTRRLLNLPDQARQAILENRISAGHGRALLKIDRPEMQLVALQAISEHDLSVREAERVGEIAKQLGGDVPSALEQIRPSRSSVERVSSGRKGRDAAERSSSQNNQSADDAEVERSLNDLLGTPVRFIRGSSDVRVTITFYGEEKLQEFLDLLSSTHTR